MGIGGPRGDECMGSRTMSHKQSIFITLKTFAHIQNYNVNDILMTFKFFSVQLSFLKKILAVIAMRGTDSQT